MCLLTTAGGLLLAPGAPDPGTAVATMVGAALAVSGANGLNMWFERDTDRLMKRTCRRPLPAGRLHPSLALWFSVTLSVLSVLVLSLGTNWLTTALAAGAILSYVLVYTPLKYRTPHALVIGAIPGAVPPLLGWTAMTGQLDPAGVVLFGILLMWQIPHFIAIALFRSQDYANAGIRALPLVRGPAMAKIQAVVWATGLVPLSLMLTPLGIAGSYYVMAATLLGTGFMAWSFTGLNNAAGPRWARGFFFASLIYLPALTLALVLDVML